MRTTSITTVFINIIWLFLLFNSCKETTTEIPPAPETGTVVDVEGNIYQTVKIGDQWWMAENLRSSRFNNGIPITLVNDILDTLKWDIKPAYCHYNNNPDAPGFLYNWRVVSDTGKIAPPGWHVPSDADWKKLEAGLGMEAAQVDSENWRGTNEGEKLKKTGPEFWVLYNPVWNTNETGFSAMAGGCRMFSKQWSYPIGLSYMGFWWTSSLAGEDMAWYRHLDYKKAGIFRDSGPRNYGFSIRCVKD